MAPLCYAAKFDPFLSLDSAPPSTLAQSKERKGLNFAIWQPWMQEQPMLTVQPNLYFGSANGDGACGGGAFEYVVQGSTVQMSDLSYYISVYFLISIN